MYGHCRPVVAGLALLGGLTAAAPAAAAPPEGQGPAKGRWEPVPVSEPETVEACGTDVTIEELVNRERQRVVDTPEQVVIEVRGALVFRFTTSDGRSAVVNASGPGRLTLSPAGVRIEASGRSFFSASGPLEEDAFRRAGLPVLAATSGPVEITGTRDPVTEDVIAFEVTRRPATVTDVCSLLR